MIRPLILTSLLVASAVASGQSWSERQQEVWGVVEQSWVDDAGETGKWPGEYITEDYTSWGADLAMPLEAGEAEKQTRFRDEGGDTLFYRIEPISIAVDGDVAVVNYYSTQVGEDSEGKRNRTVTGITETLVRRDGRWRFLSSTGWEPDFD